MRFTDLSSDRVVRALERGGFWILREGRHIGMTDGRRKITIPRHERVNPYTLKGIIRDAGLTEEEFRQLL